MGAALEAVDEDEEVLVFVGREVVVLLVLVALFQGGVGGVDFVGFFDEDGGFL